MSSYLERVIVAVDVVDYAEFEKVFSRTRELFSWYKIHSIFLSEHSRVCDELKENGKKIFLDLKFFDIPATVEKHIRVVSRFSDMITIHLLSGRDTIRVAAEVSKECNTIPVGVSVLTSFTDDTIREIGICNSIVDEVLRLVELGIGCGITHFVCSPMEVKILKNRFDGITVITPGVRISSNVDDQKRITTPREAFASGADYIVMGRDLIRLTKVDDILSYI
ncbi:MAG: orotidine-5'-phosphate decarboxylase [Spirochaetia bacterium]|nr:orotidine-5'-phosphate decarboxylase [Spirochaetota bacterium]MCX8097305.1 orotidine-5'-phosphate decarboxylase [Spirochaetota bacterium]MDW8112846.1 orotidine-5'-phosphate decarboxylase [Spirochaetia bacterium]